MDFQDKVLVCRDCGKEFLFSAGEQAFYAEKGFQNEPTRCRNCRAARKGGAGAAAPESGGGYCLAPSLDTEAYVGMVCDDRPASTLAAGATSTFVSWAITTGGRPTWVLVGRIGDPGAAAVSVFDLRIDLATNGFFAGAVPTEAWDRLSTATGTLTVLDSDGLTVRTSCVTLGPSPKAIPADSTAVVPSEIDARVSCDEEKPAASSDVFPAETDGTETTRQP